MTTEPYVPTAPIPTNVSGSRFKSDRGLLKTRSLFFEVCINSDAAIYTLKDHDHLHCKSLYLLYMGEQDPTEYIFATKHLDSWTHWEMLASSNFFLPYVERWRKELKLKMQADQIQKIRVLAESGTDRGAYEAQKYLAERKWLEPEAKAAPKRGRPSKDELNKIANEHFNESKLLEEQLSRIQGGIN